MIFLPIGILFGIAGELIMVAIFSAGLSLVVSSIAVCVSDEIIFIDAFKWSLCCSMIIFSLLFRASIFSWALVALFICLLQYPNTIKTKTAQRQTSTQNSVPQNIKNTYVNNSQKQKVIAQAANLVLMSSQSQLQELYYNSVALGYIEDNPTAFCISVGKYYYRIPSTKESAPIIKKLYEYCKNDPILIGNMNKYKNAVEVAIVLNNYKALSELGEMIFRKY